MIDATKSHFEKLRPKDRVHQNLQVVAGGGIAMEVDGAGLFEDAAEFDEARGHHGEVGHHVGAVEVGLEGAEGVGDATALLDDLLQSTHGLVVPLPGVLEGVNLGAGLGAVLFGEEDVVVLAGVEGRVEINQINSLVLDVAPEDVEIVTVVERVFWGGHGVGMRLPHCDGGMWWFQSPHMPSAPTRALAPEVCFSCLLLENVTISASCQGRDKALLRCARCLHSIQYLLRFLLQHRPHSLVLNRTLLMQEPIAPEGCPTERKTKPVHN